MKRSRSPGKIYACPFFPYTGYFEYNPSTGDKPRKCQDKTCYAIARANDADLLVCSPAHFKEHYLPRPSQTDMEQVTNALTSQGVLCNGRLTAPENDIKMKAPIVLKRIVQGIQQSKFPTQQPEFILCPGAQISTDLYNASHKIDAYLRLGEPPLRVSRGVHSSVIAVPFAFQRFRGGQQNYQCQEVLPLCYHILNDDARRTWVYAVSMRGANMSVWYFSRSHIAKSCSFSLLENPESLVSVLVSLLFASTEELGYDTRITYIPEDSSYVYKIRRPNDRSLSYFRTVGSIVRPHALRLTGCATRIWKATEVESPITAKPISKKVVVIKDVWLYTNQETEYVKQQQLFEDIRSVFSKDGSNTAKQGQERAKALQERGCCAVNRYMQDDEFKKLFLLIDQQDIGIATHSVDTKKCLRAPGLLISAWVEDYMGQGTAQTYPVNPKVPDTARQANPRRHCFFLMNDVCSPVYELRTLGVAFNVLLQAEIALQLMYCAGWVHRDISSGNVLAYRANDEDHWTVKLADLEYSQRCNLDGAASTDPKTGTIFFLPVEIAMGYYIFPSPIGRVETLPDVWYHEGRWTANVRPKDEKSPNDEPAYDEPGYDGLGYDEAQDEEDEDEDDEPEDDESKNKKPRPAFVHNYQHDLESLCWLALYIFVSRIGRLKEGNEGINAIAAACFSGPTSVPNRQALILGQKEIQDFGSVPKRVRGLSQRFDRLFEKFAYHYQERMNRGELTVDKSYGACHALVHDFLVEVSGPAMPWYRQALLAIPPPNPHRKAIGNQPSTRNRPPPDDGDFQPESESVPIANPTTPSSRSATCGKEEEGGNPSSICVGGSSRRKAGAQSRRVVTTRSKSKKSRQT